MKRKQQTIQSIRIYRNNDPIVVVGSVMYDGSCFEIQGEESTIASRPFFKPWGSSPGGAWWVELRRPTGRVVTRSLGDLGCPGYAYDNRPNLFCLTREEQAKAYVAHSDWLDDLNSHRIDW